MWSVYDSNVRLDGIQAMGRKACAIRHPECDIKMYALGVKLKSRRLCATEGLSPLQAIDKAVEQAKSRQLRDAAPDGMAEWDWDSFSRTSGLVAMTFRGYRGIGLEQKPQPPSRSMLKRSCNYALMASGQSIYRHQTSAKYHSRCLIAVPQSLTSPLAFSPGCSVNTQSIDDRPNNEPQGMLASEWCDSDHARIWTRTCLPSNTKSTSTSLRRG
jgi:hypothetical protein